MSDISEGNKNLLRYILFVGKCGQYVLREYLEKLVLSKYTDLKECIGQNLELLKRKVNDKQKKILETEPINLNTWDVSLLCEVILTVFRHDVPRNERTLIRSTRDKRNNVCHRGSFEISPDDFDDEWRDLSSIFIQLSNNLSKEVRDVVQKKIGDYKRIDIGERLPEDDELSSILSNLRNYFDRGQISQDQKTTKLREAIQTLQIIEMDTQRTTDICINIDLHTPLDTPVKKQFEELCVSIYNNSHIASEQGSEDIQYIFRLLKEKLSCDGINEIKRAFARCMSIQVRCPTRKGLEQLLRFMISEEFSESISQLSNVISRLSSQEVRVTATLSERSMMRIAALTDGSKGTDIAKNERACEKHHDQEVEYYCGTHDDVFCTKCLVLDHKQCQDIQSLTRTGVVKHVDVTRTLKELHNVRKTIQETCESFEKDLLRINTLREQQEDRIFRQKMNLQEALKEVEKQQQECVKHYEKLEKEKIEEIETQSLSCEVTLKDIETIVANVEKIQSSAPVEQFIAMKKSEHMLARSKQIIAEKRRKQKEIFISPEEIKFKVEPRHLEKAIDNIQEDIKQYEIEQSSDETHSISLVETTGTESVKPAVKSTKGYKPSPKLHPSPDPSVRKVNVSSIDDRGPTSAVGCCMLPSGEIIIADNNNSRLKRIKDDKFHDSLDLLGHPWDTCVTGKHSIAVAVYKNTLQFVRTGHKMTIERTVTLSHNCRSIAFDDISQKLIVLDTTNVYVYTTSGIQKRILYQQISPDRRLRHIAVSPTGNQLCISSFEGKLTTIDNDGNQLYSTELNHTTGGVCYSSDSTIYLTHRNGVLQLDKELNIMQNLNRGISNPLSVCFNKGTSELTVGQDNDNVTILEV